MERSTVIDMMADAMWTLAAMEAESEGLRKANVGSRCHQAGIVEGYARILALMIGEEHDGVQWITPLVQGAVRSILKSLTENQAASAEQARRRVHTGLRVGVLSLVMA